MTARRIVIAAATIPVVGLITLAVAGMLRDWCSDGEWVEGDDR